MNPWLQRFLISWAAGIVATGTVVTTAKKPHKLKKKKRKKNTDGTFAPVSVGATALKDAKLPEERGLTMGEWKDNVTATGSAFGSRVAAVFKRAPPSPSPSAGATDEGALEPDEVQSKDGARIRRRVKRKGSVAKGHTGSRGKKRKQATLWDSAKESLKQTVKDTVKEEVQQSSMGSAFESLKSVGAKVKEGATQAASSAAKTVNALIEKQQQSSKEKPPASPSDDDAIDVVKDNGPAQKPVDPAEVAAKVKNSVNVVGSWLQGPGAPGYGKRIRKESGGDVVEAKDAPEDPIN